MPRRTDAIEVGGVRISSPDDVLYPEQGITKRALAEYYAAMAPRILPELRGRPLTLVRCPEGEGEECFYQRHAAERGPLATLKRVSLGEPDGGRSDYLMVAGTRSLLSLAQMRVLEVHTWGARSDLPHRPDRMVLDLDPGPGVGWAAIRDAAFMFRDRLSSVGLVSFAKTTGGRGLHVVVPLARRHEWERVKSFARSLAETAQADDPSRFISTASKAAREGRIYVDYLRNGWGASIVAAYSTRARRGAPVSTPVSWEELAGGVTPDEFDIVSVPRRMATLRFHPWQGYGDAARQVITRQAEQRLDPGRSQNSAASGHTRRGRGHKPAERPATR